MAAFDSRPLWNAKRRRAVWSFARAVRLAAENAVLGLLTRLEARRASAHLQAFDDRMLKDIGIGRGEILSFLASGNHDRQSRW